MPLVEMGNGQGREKVAMYIDRHYISAYYINFIHMALNPVNNDEDIQTTYTYSHSDNPWNSLELQGEAIKVKVNGGGTGYGPSSVTITALESGRFIGHSNDAYGGARHEIDDYINAGESKTYTGTYGVSALYGIFI